MVWIVASGVALAFCVLLLGLCRMAASLTEEDRRAADEAEIEWLRHCSAGGEEAKRLSSYATEA
jgi:hypothetical protein